MEVPCRVEMLGGLRVHQAGRSIARFSTERTAALLAYLAYHLDCAHPREVLAEVVWPGRPPRSGRDSLNTALSSLRRQLEPPGVPTGAIIQSDRFSVQLDPESVATDVREFEGALCAAAAADSTLVRLQSLRAALDLHRGDLLPGFYDEWVPAAQRRLADRYFEAALQLAALLERSGDLPRATEIVREAIARDPLREEAHGELMRLYAASGEPIAALRQYTGLKKLLAQELGQEPSAATEQLARKIRSSAPDVATVRTATEPTAVRQGPELPSGTVTLLLTDIEGSTALRERMGDAFREALEGYRALLRREFRRHGAQEVREAGESFIVPLSSATDAAECAVASQKALAAHSWPREVGTFRVRMALCTADVRPTEGNSHDGVLDRATRMAAAAHGGQILCSEATAALLKGDVRLDLSVTDLGAYRLDGPWTPERVFQVEYPGMPQSGFPSVRAEAIPGGNLPLQFTRFFGREAELTRLSDLLRAEDTRLVVLTGPGGSGKTRLAVEAARRLREAFRGAIWFVGLQELAEASEIPAAIAEALQLPSSAHAEPLDQAVVALSAQPSVLVLDNLEHLLDQGVPVVQALMQRVPSLKCVITSREVLNLNGEVEMVVAPLPVPRGDEGLEELARCPSVQLFVDRAQAVQPDFQVTQSNAAVVGELCGRLEGIPLALELAAARRHVLSPAQMVAQLDDRLDLLVSHKRDLPARHRSLWAAVEWSYRLLSADERRFLARLSVFRGGWTAEAAEEVCEQPQALDHLQHLVECSLVLAEEGEQGTRFRQLETLREFGQEQLSADELADLQLRHAQHFLALARRSLEKLYSEDRLAWLGRIDSEHSNMRAVLEWASRRRPQLGLELATALSVYWHWRDFTREGSQWLTTMLSAAVDAPPRLRGGGLVAAARLAYRLSDYPLTRRLAEEALRALRSAGDTPALGNALGLLGSVAVVGGDFGRAPTLLEEAVRAFEAMEDVGGVAWVMCELAECAAARGHHAHAEELLTGAAARYRQVRNPLGLAFPLEKLGRMAYFRGDYARAVEPLQECVRLYRADGSPLHLAWTLGCLGDVLLALDQTESAQSHFAESLRICWGQAHQAMAMWGVRGLAKVAGTRGCAERLARLFGAAEAIGERVGLPHVDPRIELADDRFVSSARAALGQAAFAGAWAEGRAMSWDQAVAYALEGEGAVPGVAPER